MQAWKTRSAAIQCLFALNGLLSATVACGQEVIPDFYREPGLNANRSYVNQSFNEHIDPFSGSLQQHYVDLHIPGNGGLDLQVVRSYNSNSIDPLNPSAYDSLAGLGWRIHFGRVLKTRDSQICLNTNTATMSDNPVLELPDGSRQLLSFTGYVSPLMLTAQRWRAMCNTGQAGGLLVYSPDGTRYDMTQMANIGTSLRPIWSWSVTKITDKNGNYADIAYRTGVSLPEITGVTTSDGRSISFSYLDSGTMTRRISSVSGAGQTYNYSYTPVSGTNAYHLDYVTRPDGTRWQYNYNGNLNTSPGSYVMNKTTHPQGGYVNYSYNFVYFDGQANPSSQATVVSSKATSTGGNWTFSYAPGSGGTYDKTTVTTPSTTVVYQHFGPNNSSSGNVWMVGLLMSKTIGSRHTETYGWSGQQISTENYFRPGAFVSKVDGGSTKAPVMTQKSIVRDGATYTTTYSNFDDYGNPGTVSEAGTSGGNRTTNLTYYIDTNKWIVRQLKDDSFANTTRSFDGNGNLSSITKDGVTTGYTYYQGDIASITYPRSLTHYFSNYRRGIPQTENRPEGVTITRVVSDAGNVTQETNGDNRTTNFGYDGLNRVTSINYPTGSPVAVVYGAASKTATRGSLTESVVYNGFGQASNVTLGGIARSFTVDALGRKTFESDPGSASGTSYAHDELDRVYRVTNADNTSQNISYGAGTKTVVDERSKSTTFTYRAYGNPDQQFLMGIATGESSANVSIGRNIRDLISSVAQAGLTRYYGYDGNFFLRTVTNPETGTTTYGRDAAGNMTSRAVGSSGTTIYGYDNLNRLKTVTYPGATPSIVNTYNGVNKLLSATSSTGNRGFGYDANGNLTSETLTIDGITFTSRYGYNGLDQLTSITYPRSSLAVNYAPDVLGRPTQVSGFVSNVTYWPSGQIQQITYANGTTSYYGQNSRLWPSTFNTGRGGTSYVNNTYVYDNVGNLSNVIDGVDNSYNRTLTYDDINRVSTIAGPWGAGSVTYDGAGNIRSQTFGGSTLTYNYDGSNRLGSVSGTRAASYAYDAYGNVSSGGGNTYAYDNVPNLQCVNCASPTSKVEYSYDAAAHRSVVNRAGVKTYEMTASSGNQLIEFTPSQSNKLVQYFYLGGKRVAQSISSQ